MPKTKIRFSVISIILFASFFFILVNKVEAKVLTVGQNTEKYKTISEAIEAAANADTILISEGVYEENLVIKKNNLEIIGEDSNKVILKSSEINQGNGIEIINSSGKTNLKILNLTIQDFNYGIYAGNDKSDLSNLVLNNLYIKNNGDTELPAGCSNNNPYKSCQNWHDTGGAIKLKNVSESNITNNIIEGNQFGIFIYDVLKESVNNEISANYIFNNQGFGIKIQNGSSGNKISGNQIYKNNGVGIELTRTDSAQDQNLIISLNQVYQNSNDGLEIKRQKNFTISNNEIVKNSITNSIPYSPGQNEIFGGIYIDYSLNGTITENKISDNSLYGIQLEKNTANISIYDNEIVLHGKSPQAIDNGSLNEFDHDKNGNYWSDFKGLNSGSEVNYLISGTAKNKDNYPKKSNPYSNFAKKINLYVEKYYPGSVTLGWNNSSVDDFKEYEIQIRNGNKTNTVNGDSEITLQKEQTNILNLANLDDSTDYLVSVSIKNKSGIKIADSNEILIHTLNKANIPKVPVNINATSIEPGKIMLYWFKNASQDDVSYYEIYRKDFDSEYQYLKKVIEPNTFFYDSNLDSETNYSYKIKAKNDNGYSLFSEEIEIIPNSRLSLNSENSVNIFNEANISLNTVISKVSDNKSELLITPSLAKKVASKNIIAIGLQANINPDNYAILSDDYTFLSANTYYYLFSDPVNTSGIETLPEEALISIRYTNDEVKDLNEDSLVIAYFDSVKGKWVPLLSQVNPNSNVVIARTRFLGVFKLLSRNNLMNFSDVKNSDWAYGYIQNLNRSGIINGYADNTFKPLSFASRAEVLKMVIMANGYKVPDYSLEDPCTDVNKDAWFSPYFQYALNSKLINGYEDQSCRPDNLINRVEALKIIIGEKALNYQTSFDFKDKSEIPTWAYPYIGYALDRKIIKGFNDNTFKPFEPIRRQELAKIIYENYKL